MHEESLLYAIFLIFFGAAVLATVALYARQALLVAYVVLGVLAGPLFGWVGNTHLIVQIADIGILFLLFLLGLDLPPAKLKRVLRDSARLTLYCSALFVLAGGGVVAFFGFGLRESVLIGLSLVFSSTIIGLKLLPTTVLHHRPTGEIIISILLLQDFLAIIVLEVLQVMGHEATAWWSVLLPLLAFPALFLLAWVVQSRIVSPLMRRYDQIHEYIFLLAIGWCLVVAEGARMLGLMPEIGAFVAGVVLARSPIAMFIAERLKPLRDFFLIMFFFTVGARFEPGIISTVIVPATILALLALVLKPILYRYFLLSSAGEQRAREVGVRLGQSSEFSLLLAMLALELGVIGSEAASLIQLATLLTFVVSPYLIVRRYPTPIGVSDELRRD